MKPLLMLTLLAAVFATGCQRGLEQREKAEIHELALRKYQLGMAFAERGDDLMALESFTHSVVIKPMAATYYQLGQTYERLGQEEAALEAYEQAIDLAPDYQEAKFAALALEDVRPQTATGEAGPTEAERQAMQERLASAQEARPPTLHEVRELLFGEAQSPDELPSATDPAYRPESEIMLGTYSFHYNNGLRMMNALNFDRAAREFERAIEADPTRLDARLQLGDALLRMNRPQQALAQYQQAHEMFPEAPQPVMKLGNYYASIDQPQKARDQYGIALFMDPNYSEALNNMAALEIRENDLPEAIRLLEMAIQADPDYALAWLNLGVARENRGDRIGAVEAYQRYLELGGKRSDEVTVWISELQ